MRWRRDEWSERLSAVVLVCASVVVLLWSRARVQDTERLLDRREEQLQQVLAWTRTNDTVPDERVVAAVTALFGRERARAVARAPEATR